jgi:tetratricopeptide (TPR) repeat protein
VRASSGRAADALHLLEECAAIPPSARGVDFVLWIPVALRIALAMGRPDVAARLAAGLPATRTYDAGVLVLLDALLDERRGQHEHAAWHFAEASARWAELGVNYELGQALLGQGRCLSALGQVTQAAAALSSARVIFASLGARPAVADAEALLESLHG